MTPRLKPTPGTPDPIVGRIGASRIQCVPIGNFLVPYVERVPVGRGLGGGWPVHLGVGSPSPRVSLWGQM
jgi:hypothetical protein